MAVNYPPVLRMTWTVCQRCGKESSMCAKVAFRVGNWNSKMFDVARMTCAGCRERNAGNWIIDCQYQGTDMHPEPKYDCVKWEQWTAENPPLSDEELAELSQDEE